MHYITMSSCSCNRTGNHTSKPATDQSELCSRFKGGDYLLKHIFGSIKAQTIASKTCSYFGIPLQMMTHSSFSRSCGSTHCQIIINLSHWSNESAFCLRRFSKARRDCQAQTQKINTSCVISHAWLTSLTTCCISHNHQILFFSPS